MDRSSMEGNLRSYIRREPFSTSTSANQASIPDSELDHWIKRVFLDDVPATPLPRTNVE
jgi:hypothetical protein